jgi:RNA polymerase sigma factor (sigma-70 family)
MHEPAELGPDSASDQISEVAVIVRRVVASRVSDRDVADEIVQETLARVLATRGRLVDGAMLPYAITIARNLVASHWRSIDIGKRHEHRLLDRRPADQPEERVVEEEETQAIRAALDRLSPEERDLVVAHEVSGQDTKSMADDLGSTPRAVVAQLHRTRAKLRVEYLLEMHGQPPTSQCHPVLLSLSAGDRRRQGELDAGHHLLGCDFCSAASEQLFDQRTKDAGETRIPIRIDADIVTARQTGRDLAIHAGFSGTEATVIATAISEIARNIVRFARRGEVAITCLDDGERSGVRIVARDAGRGIADIDQAMMVGYTTYGGRGLGLPGSRRLMDEFEITSEIDRGTTVTMTKWHRR